VCDPAVKRSANSLKDRLDGLLFSIGENDGTNQPKREECYTKQQLTSEANNGFGVIESKNRCEITEIGEDLIISYQII
jgi:hypothetical protein